MPGVALWSALVFLCALTVYLRTLAPSITWAHAGADSGDFASAVACGGVPHPTGYPTYLLLAEVFSRLPWGDCAFRLNLLSAFAAAMAAGMLVLLVSHAARHGAKNPPATGAAPAAAAPISAGLLLAFNPTVWSQAVIAETYTLQLGFVLAALLLAAWAHRQRSYGAIAVTFLLCGGALGNHVSFVLVLPALVWMLRRLLFAHPVAFAATALLPLAAGLSVYAVIPLRAAAIPPVNWGGASTWHGFWWLVSGQLYLDFVFGLPLGALPGRLLAWSGMLLTAMNGWGLPFGLLGVTTLVKRDAAFGFGTLSVFLWFSAYAVCYDTTDSYVYLLPAIAMLLLWIGCGLQRAAAAMEPHLDGNVWKRCTLAGAILLLSVCAVPLSWSGQDLSHDTEARDFGLEALAAAAPDSLIITEGDAHTFALWYARYGMGKRQDIAVVNDALLRFDWYRAILRKHHPGVLGDADTITGLAPLLAHNVGRRPVYFTAEPASLPGYRATPSGPLWRLTAAPSAAPQPE